MREKLLRWVVPLLLIASVPAIGWLDYVTGPDVGLSLFYLVPIGLAAWYFPTWFAVAIALEASAAWVLAELPWRPAIDNRFVLWNGLTRLTIYLLIALMESRVRRDRDRLNELNERLKVALDVESGIARTDALTTLRNSRSFVEQLEIELARSRRAGGEPISVAYLDIDNFKALNDQHGHAAGDEMLRQIGRTLRESVRTSDIVARLGGDEFAILFWRADRETVQRAVDRISERVEILAAPYRDVGLGASIGIVTFDEPPSTPDEIMRGADSAMYGAKRERKAKLVATPVAALAP